MNVYMRRFAPNLSSDTWMHAHTFLVAMGQNCLHLLSKMFLVGSIYTDTMSQNGGWQAQRLVTHFWSWRNVGSDARIVQNTLVLKAQRLLLLPCIFVNLPEIDLFFETETVSSYRFTRGLLRYSGWSSRASSSRRPKPCRRDGALWCWLSRVTVPLAQQVF